MVNHSVPFSIIISPSGNSPPVSIKPSIPKVKNLRPKVQPGMKEAKE